MNDHGPESTTWPEIILYALLLCSVAAILAALICTCAGCAAMDEAAPAAAKALQVAGSAAREMAKELPGLPGTALWLAGVAATGLAGCAGALARGRKLKRAAAATAAAIEAYRELKPDAWGELGNLLARFQDTQGVRNTMRAIRRRAGIGPRTPARIPSPRKRNAASRKR